MTGSGERQLVEAAAAFLRQRLPALRQGTVRAALVLGSGLREFTATLQGGEAVAFGEVPHWPEPAVAGHGGELVVGSAGGAVVACLTGRVHLYEGHAPATVVRAVRTLRLLGVQVFVLTNAAGGIGEDLSAGDLMVITDHLNLTGSSPLVGPHEPLFGPRFPDQSRVWDPALRRLLLRCGIGLQHGVYAGVLGPSYETPAEIESLRRLGASAVGMSTVHEAIALHAMGARLAGLSLISNLAAGIGDAPLDHDEVMAAGRQASAAVSALLHAFCTGLS